MTVQRIIFHGFDAFLAGFTAPGKVKVWIDKRHAKSVDYTKVIDVDFATTLTNAGSFAQITLDDNTYDGGLTRFNPNGDADPHIGGVYLRDLDAASLVATWPNIGEGVNHDFQLQSVVYVDDETRPVTILRRYYGFYAAMTGKSRDGKVGDFTVWSGTEDPDHPTNPPEGTSVKLNIDEADNPGVDWYEHDQGTSKVRQPGDRGSLFIRWDVAKSFNLKSPKLPLGENPPQGFP